MADFCSQCAGDMAFPASDFIGCTPPEEWAKGRAAIVLCEGCGPIQVDPEGRCVSADCLEKHGSPT